MQNIASYLINLDKDKERLAATSQQLSQHGIDFERIPAIWGKDADPTPAAGAAKATGRALLPGEIGCFLSHRAAAEAFLATDKELGLVLEDDLIVTEHAAETLTAFARCAAQLTNWSVVNLARPVKHQFTQLPATLWDGPVPLYRAHYMPVTTAALLWNRSGAKEFLRRTEVFNQPVDVFIQNWVAETDRGLAFLSPPFASRQGNSSIGNGRSAGRNPLSKAQRHRVHSLISRHLAARQHKRKQR